MASRKETKKIDPEEYEAQRFREEGNKEQYDYISGLVAPREAYRNGELRLDYAYRFSTGEVLKVQEDNDGLVSAVIEREGKVIVDFAQLAKQEGYELVSARYVIKNRLDKSQRFVPGEWAASVPSKKDKYITVGDMTSPKLIMTMLHEMGHSRFNHSWEEILKIIPKSYNSDQKMKIALSIRERNAWAGALKIVRDIKKNHNINLLEVFGSFDEFKKFMYSALATYRYGAEMDTVDQDKIYLKLWRYLRNESAANAKSTEFYASYFDKKKYSQKDEDRQKRINSDAIKINKLRKELGIY